MSESLEATPQVTNAVDIIREEIKVALTTLGQNAEVAKDKINHFLVSIEPEINQAITSGDLKSLNLIRDRIAAHLARVSLGLLHQQRAAVLAVVITTLRLLIKFATGVIVI